MKIQFALLMLFLGVILTVHLTMNGRVGAAMNNLQVANAVFWCIGAATAVVIGLTNWKQGALSPLKDINPLLLTAGAMGGCLVFGISYCYSNFSPASATVCLLAGQQISALVITQFGLLGAPQQSATPLKLGGALVLLIGVWMTVYTPSNAAAAPAVQNAPVMQPDAAKK